MQKLLACVLAASFTLAGQTLVTFRSSVDQSEQPYALYAPKSSTPGHRIPVIVSLHAEESNHIVELKRVFGIPPRYGETGLHALTTLGVLPSVDFLVACPLARGTMGYQGIAEQDVYDMLADVKRRYPVDEERIYLTGSSMGGGGALWLGLTRPDIWAAVAPLCPDVFPGTAELAPNALNLPMRLFHGDQDPAVPVDASRQWQRRLLSLDSPVEYIEFPGVRHNAWDFAYKDGAIFEWFSKFRRNPNPDRVRLAAREARYGAAYWVRIDALAAGALGSLDAVRSAAGIQVQTRDVDAFTLSTAAKSADHRWRAGAPEAGRAAFLHQDRARLDAGSSRRRSPPGTHRGSGQLPPHLRLRLERCADPPLRRNRRRLEQQSHAIEPRTPGQKRSGGERRRPG